MEPSVCIEYLVCSVRILEISEEYICALDKDLTRNIDRIVWIDLKLNVRNAFSAWVQSGCLPVVESDDWSTFCHTISYRIRELHALEECLNFLIECCTTDNDLIEVTAECLYKLCLDLVHNNLIKTRNLHRKLDSRFLKNWLNLVLIYFLNDKRNGDYNSRLDFRESLHDDLRARKAWQEVYMTTDAEFIKNFEHKAVHVGTWKHWNHLWCMVKCRQCFSSEVNIRPDCPVWNHYTFWEAWCSRRVVDDCQFICRIFIIIDWVSSECLRVLSPIQFV